MINCNSICCSLFSCQTKKELTIMVFCDIMIKQKFLSMLRGNVAGGKEYQNGLPIVIFVLAGKW